MVDRDDQAAGGAGPRFDPAAAYSGGNTDPNEMGGLEGTAGVGGWGDAAGADAGDRPAASAAGDTGTGSVGRRTGGDSTLDLGGTEASIGNQARPGHPAGASSDTGD